MDTILIVDDEPDMLDGLRAVLEEEQYRVIACSDGHEARMRVFEDPPDLIISDIRMPGMDGWALVEELRQLPLTRNTPFLFLTGHAAAETYADALRSGVDGVMTKPIRPADLVAAVRSRLERTRAIEARSAASHELFQTTLSRALPHGLNTSLHIISGYATLLESTSDLDRPSIAEYSDRIQQAARQLQASLQKLWLLLSLEEQYAMERRGSSPDQASGTPLAPALHDVVKALSSAGGRSITIDGNVEHVGLRIATPYLQDLLREVIDNAVRFSPPSSPVHVTVSTDASSATITVTDRGRGLVSGTVDGLAAFEQFQRDRFERKGHGLGLTIVHRILRLVGGDISVSGSPGEGTSVELTLRRLPT